MLTRSFVWDCVEICDGGLDTFNGLDFMVRVTLTMAHLMMVREARTMATRLINGS